MPIVKKEVSEALEKKIVKNIDNEPCEYELFDSNAKLIYTGSSCKCKTRLSQQRRHFPQAKMFRARFTQSCPEARKLEKFLCLINKPPVNKKCR